MAGDTIRYVDQGVSVKVEGLNRVLRKLSAAGTDAQNMRGLMQELGGMVISRANVPRRTGRLAASLRPGRGKTKAVVRAGYESRIPYAGRIHYGDPRPGIVGQPFLTTALQQARPSVFEALEAGIDDLLKKNNLK